MAELYRTQLSKYEVEHVIPLVQAVAEEVAEESGFSLGFEHMQITDPGVKQHLLLGIEERDRMIPDIYMVAHPFIRDRQGVRRFVELIDYAGRLFPAEEVNTERGKINIYIAQTAIRGELALLTQAAKNGRRVFA